MVESSKKLSDDAYPILLQRVLALGETEERLKRTLLYIRDEAPIIIHVNAFIITNFLIKDEFYRNQFETKSSNGYLCQDTRTRWEDRMFNSIYHDSPGFDRVKYGVLNIYNNPIGVSSAICYGEENIVLKNVRLRTSFASCDSGEDRAVIASCEYYCHVLYTFPESELLTTIKVANNVSDDPHFHDDESSCQINDYKEIQIHGPISLDTDVEALIVDPNTPSLPELKAFCRKNGIVLKSKINREIIPLHK